MKPTITKEQEAELEAMRTSFPGGDKYILMAACDDVLGGKLAKLDLMTLAAALVNGYEVEKTPEEKVREYFEKLWTCCCGTDEIEIAEETIINTLNLLGIKIEGVNA
ncbi:hypothetical protein [Bacillus halotolerans]|uniref:hypothetical protein n=1 Tax=Bacillus halotolerans TaxID=260554 RepID=UPI002DBC834D|nr:hypothetical protein [Bacillus halotolerans]MEC1648233.1 hypothetical protein [Bacillus halotolerans]